jgi:hypothetical protein
MSAEHLKPTYRVQRTEDGLAPETDITLQGTLTYLREALLRPRYPADLLHLKDESLIEHIRNGIILVEKMEIGERASNGLLVDLKWHNTDRRSKSRFGRVLHEAMDNPLLSDHNSDHLQRVEDHVIWTALNVAEMRKQAELQPWVSSLMLFVRWHDVDQLLSQQRNISRVLHGVPELKTKLGHGPGGAVMLLAFHKRYAEEANMPIGDAWRVCAGAAAMTLIHDNPEQFAKAVNARKPAWEWRHNKKHYLEGKELSAAFHAAEIDVFSLLPHQIIGLLREEKSRQSEFFHTSQYGLHPLFEKEYAKDLQELNDNMRPLMQEIVENPALYVSWRRGFTTTAEMGERGDLADMITPPYEAVLRTLLTPISRKRVFFRSDTRNLLREVMYGKGNADVEIDHDVRRIVWEFFHIDALEGSTIAESAYIKRFNRDNALMGILAFKKITLELFAGNVEFVDSIYERRIGQIGRNAIAKAKVSALNRLGLSLRKARVEDIKEQIAYVAQEIGKKNNDLSQRYQGKAHELLKEWQTIKNNLQVKKLVAEDGVSQEEAAHVFVAFIDQAIVKLCEIHNVSPKQLKRYKSRVARGKYPMLPYKTYDPLGGNPRTYMSPRNTKPPGARKDNGK